MSRENLKKVEIELGSLPTTCMQAETAGKAVAALQELRSDLAEAGYYEKLVKPLYTGWQHRPIGGV